MNTIAFTFQSGDGVEIAKAHIPPTPRPDFPSCGVFAFPKSGSTLVNAIVRDLMAETNVPVIDWPELWHARGIDIGTVQGDLTQLFPSHGYCLAGFREIPDSFLGASAIAHMRKLMVVRDPRDMLVSRYFSVKFSHGFKIRGTPQFATIMRQSIEDCEMDLDKYCLFNSWIINEGFYLHRDIITDPQTLVLKYEDFVYNKEHLASAICNWFSLDIPKIRLFAIIAPYEVIPVTERLDRHMRQVHPGDHRRKLNPETVTALNGVLGKFMAAFGY